MSLSSSSSFDSLDSFSIRRAFSENLNIPTGAPGDVSKVLGIMQKILSDTSLTDLQPSLVGTLGERVTALQSLLDPSYIQSRMGVAAAEALRIELKGLLENKIVELKSIVSKEAKAAFIQKHLPEIPAHRIASFVSTVEGFYGQALSEGKDPKAALIFALGKGIARALLRLPSTDEIKSIAGLSEKIEAESSLEPYMDAITFELISSDPLYWRTEDGVPCERYDQNTVEQLEDITVGAVFGKKDPRTRLPAPPEAIKVDHEGKEFIDSKIFPMLYPALTTTFSSSIEIEAILSDVYLLALGAAYPCIGVSVEYEEAVAFPDNLDSLIGAVEGLTRMALDQFMSLMEGMNFKWEEVDLACFSVIKEELREMRRQLIGGNLEELREEFIKKVEVLLAYHREIESSSISSASKEEAFKLGAYYIWIGSSLEEVSASFAIGASHVEDEIRKAFPGCLLGYAEWRIHLGAVEKVPLPEGILSILSGPCPIIPGKKVGETHMLILIPETLNRHSLTLNSLMALVENKRHYSDRKERYAYISPEVVGAHGNKPAGGAHYVLMTRDILPGSRSKNYMEQQTMVMELSRKSKVEYEVPSVLPVVAGVLVNYFTSGVRLFGDKPWTHTRCQEIVGYYPVVVGGFAPAGFRVEFFFAPSLFYTLDCIGIAALRKL